MIQVYDLPRVIRSTQFSMHYMEKGKILFLTQDAKNQQQFFVQGYLPFDNCSELDSYLKEVKDLEVRGAMDHISHIVRVHPAKPMDARSYVEMCSVESLEKPGHTTQAEHSSKDDRVDDFKKDAPTRPGNLDDDPQYQKYQEYLYKKRQIERMKRREEKRREMRSRQFAAEMEDAEEAIDIKADIKAWLSKTSFADFLAAISKRVKGQVDLERFMANVYHYFTIIAAGGRPNNNVLLAAPSGCGKTETFRALKDYFKNQLPHLPIAQIDMSTITEAGFRGADSKEAIRCLIENSQTHGVGLIFMDEFDKKLIPSYTSAGNNVNAAVQAQLLTLIEGLEIPGCGVDTNNTLFVGLGSFDTCRSKRAVVPKSLGFNAEAKAPVDHYDDITREDMIQLGASYELLGRFSMVVNYHKLDEQTIDHIIDDNIYKIAKSVGYAVQLTDEKRAQMHQHANGKFGCRMLYNEILDGVMMMYPQLLKNRCRKWYYTIVLGADGNHVIEKGRVKMER